MVGRQSYRKPFRAVPIREGEAYRAKRLAMTRTLLVKQALKYSIVAVAVGTFIGYLTARTDDGEMRAFLLSEEIQSSFQSSDSKQAYYGNCSHARFAGAAPIYRGEHGYRPELDRDNDGIVCEPFRSWWGMR